MDPLPERVRLVAAPGATATATSCWTTDGSETALICRLSDGSAGALPARWTDLSWQVEPEAPVGGAGSPAGWRLLPGAARDCGRAVRAGVEPPAKTEAEMSGQLALATDEETLVAAAMWETLPPERQREAGRVRVRAHPHRQVPGRSGPGAPAHRGAADRAVVCLFPEHHPGYVSWDEHLATRERLAANVIRRGEGGGAAREGTALLQGLVRCGRRMQVAYSGTSGRVARYACVRAHHLHGTDHACQSLDGLRLEKAVASAFVDAVTPAGVRASAQSIDQVTQR